MKKISKIWILDLCCHCVEW